MKEMQGPGAFKAGEKRRIARNVFFAVFIGLLINALLGVMTDINAAMTAIRSAGWLELIPPFACGLVVYLLDSFRFRLIFRQFRIRLAWRDAFYANLLGSFFSGITPGFTGGQPFQIYQFTRLGLDSTIATNIVFSRLMVSNISQIVIIVALVSIGGGFAVFGSAGTGGFILGIGLTITLAVFALLFLLFLKPVLAGHLALALDRSRIGRLIGRWTKNEAWAEKMYAWSFGLQDSFRFLWSKRIGILLVDLAMHICDQAIWAFGLYLPFRLLTGMTIPFLPFLFAYNLCGLVSGFIPTPGASGSVEATYALVLGNLAPESGAAFSAILVWRFGSYYLHLLLTGLIYAAAGWGRKSYFPGPDGWVRRSITNDDPQKLEDAHIAG